MRVLVTAGWVLLSSTLAWAQQPAPQSPAPDPTKAMYMSAADVNKAVAASAAKQGTTANAPTRVFQLAPYTVTIEHRIGVPQNASIHDKEAELFYVIDGAATIVTGGKLVEPTRTGDNVTGTSIEGGTSQVLGKGDFLLVPPGVAHWFSSVQGSVTPMSLHLPMPAAK
jgi:mannose-6-phosphate isomerase-like protein (cupin superfamily)